MVVAVPLVTLLVATTAFAGLEVQAHRTEARVNQAFEIQSQLGEVLALVIDAETGVRGDLLARNAAFLAPFTTAEAALPGALGALEHLVKGRQVESADLRAVRADVGRDLAVLTRLRALGPEKAATLPAQRLLASGKHVTDTLRRDVATMEHHDAERLAIEEASAHRAELAALGLVAAAVLVGLVGGAIATALFGSGVARRVTAIEANAGRLARGEPLEPLERAGDEVGRLGTALAVASTLLAEREAALAEERAFFEHLVSASSIVKFTGDSALPGGGYLSPNVVRLTGYSPAELTAGRPSWINLVHPEDRREVTNDVAAAVSGGATKLDQEYRVVHRDGTTRWIYSVTSIDRGLDGSVVGALGSLVDITERRVAENALREREQTLAAVFAASPDPILIVDADQVIRSASHAAAVMFGVAVEGRRLDGLVAPASWLALRAGLVELVARSRSELEIRVELRRPGGGQITAEIHGCALAVASDTAESLVLAARDVTAQVQLEHGLQRARTDAEEANRAKSEFLSRMSHELRTPLNAVLGFAQLLEMGTLEDGQGESVHQILRGGRHLLDLINEVLDISRIEAGRLVLSPEPVLVSEVGAEVLELLRPLAEQRRIVLVGGALDGCDRHVVADRQRLKQVLLNLVSNAIKYNRRDGTVRLECARAAKERLRIAVIDTGIGISLDQLERAFVPFERLGAERSDVEGTGVGLALSRRLTEAMGGAITVESTPGVGSTFAVELPLAEGQLDRLERLDSPHDEASGRLAPPSTGRKCRVLYVEDNSSNVKLIQAVLAQRQGVELVVAGHGRLALELARAQLPDLVLLDLHLPDMTGDEVLVELRDDPRTSRIPIVVLSADATPGHVQRLLSSGARSYLTKPLEVGALLAVLDVVMTPL